MFINTQSAGTEIKAGASEDAPMQVIFKSLCYLISLDQFNLTHQQRPLLQQLEEQTLQRLEEVQEL